MCGAMSNERNAPKRPKARHETHDISKVEVGGARKKSTRRSVENIGINQSSNYN